VEKIIKVRVAPVPEIAADVSRLLRKDKGFATRLQDWQHIQRVLSMGAALIEEHAETSQEWKWWERTMLRALPSVLLMGCSSDRVGKNC
jgi:hypothetical protein